MAAASAVMSAMRTMPLHQRALHSIAPSSSGAGTPPSSPTALGGPTSYDPFKGASSSAEPASAPAAMANSSAERSGGGSGGVGGLEDMVSPLLARQRRLAVGSGSSAGSEASSAPALVAPPAPFFAAGGALGGAMPSILSPDMAPHPIAPLLTYLWGPAPQPLPTPNAAGPASAAGQRDPFSDPLFSGALGAAAAGSSTAPAPSVGAQAAAAAVRALALALALASPVGAAAMAHGRAAGTVGALAAGSCMVAVPLMSALRGGPAGASARRRVAGRSGGGGSASAGDAPSDQGDNDDADSPRRGASTTVAVSWSKPPTGRSAGTTSAGGGIRTMMMTGHVRGCSGLDTQAADAEETVTASGTPASTPYRLPLWWLLFAVAACVRASAVCAGSNT